MSVSITRCLRGKLTPRRRFRIGVYDAPELTCTYSYPRARLETSSTALRSIQEMPSCGAKSFLLLVTGEVSREACTFFRSRGGAVSFLTKNRLSDQKYPRRPPWRAMAQSLCDTALAYSMTRVSSQSISIFLLANISYRYCGCALPSSLYRERSLRSGAGSAEPREKKNCFTRGG